MLYFVIGVVVGALLIIVISAVIVAGQCSEAERRAEQDAQADMSK